MWPTPEVVVFVVVVEQRVYVDLLLKEDWTSIFFVIVNRLDLVPHPCHNLDGLGIHILLIQQQKQDVGQKSFTRKMVMVIHRRGRVLRYKIAETRNGRHALTSSVIPMVLFFIN